MKCKSETTPRTQQKKPDASVPNPKNPKSDKIKQCQNQNQENQENKIF